jgi:FkbH-like protein
MDRLDWQRAVFAEKPRLSVLLELLPTWPLRHIRCHVHRNAPFEHVANAARPFLAYAGYDVAFTYSDYDDSFSSRRPGSADLEVIWVDYERYMDRLAPGELTDWLADRLAQLREHSVAPILLNLLETEDPAAVEANSRLQALATLIPGLHLCDTGEVRRLLGEGFKDTRMKDLSGWGLSREATLLIAQRFGLVWFPSTLEPRIKAIVLDLDDTLYDGVLGEDGIAGVVISDDHRRLNTELVRFASEGVFLAIASKNDPRDVDGLWAGRHDLGLAPANLSAVAVGWGSKATAIEQVAAALRIGADAMLVVDDNPGELASVAASHPGIRLLRAGRPEETRRALRIYPGLAGYAVSETDALRFADSLGAAERARGLQSSRNASDYMRSLQIRLTFALDHLDQVRLHELSVKTNQFNTGLLRLTEAEVARRIASADHSTATVGLRDRLSDSGVVAAVFATIRSSTLQVDEIDISCRALGRGVEDVMIAEAVSRMAREAGCATVSFRLALGPRNEPARMWFERLAGRRANASEIEFEVEVDRLTEDARTDSPVDVSWTGRST